MSLAMDDKYVPVEKLKNMLAGGIAGMCSKTAVAPLDRIKILFQAQNNHYKHLGVWSGLTTIVKRESWLALYKGNGAQMVRVFPNAAIHFTAFETYKKYFMDTWIVGTNSIIGTFFAKFGAGGFAGVTAVTSTYPLDTIRARLAFQVTGEHKYTGIINAGTTIYRTEGGMLALYRGFLPSVCGMFINSGISFSVYETLKSFCKKHFPDIACKESSQNSGGLDLKMPANSLCGATAGGVSTLFYYPFDVTRRRMQLAKMNPETAKFGTSMTSSIVLIYKENKIVRGLYRGMSINLWRACPMQAVSYSTYELMKRILNLDTGSS